MRTNLYQNRANFGQSFGINYGAGAQLDYGQLGERRDWFLKLGLSPNCAHELALHTLEHQELDFVYYTQRWAQLSAQLGSERQPEVDAMVLRAIREVLQNKTQPLLPNPVQQQQPQRCYPRTPSPPRDINWHGAESHYQSPYANRGAGSFQLHMCSTPVRIWEHQQEEQQQQQSSPLEDVYDIHADPRDLPEPLPYLQPYERSLQLRNAVREFEASTGLLDINYSNRTPVINYYREDEPPLTPMPPRPPARRLRIESPPPPRRELPPHREPPRHDWRERKRAAEPYQQGQAQSKRRQLEQPRHFRIGEHTLPYLTHKSTQLPQPEHKSYAVHFFKRRHCYIIGGPAAATPMAKPAAEPPASSSLCTRSSAKRIRQHLREDWKLHYDEQGYDSWPNWWRDFRWCESAIAKQLELHKGVNVQDKPLLHMAFNYSKPQAVKTLMNLAHLALELDTTNFQAILGTIFELMKKQLLDQLSPYQLGVLQDIIRYLPNCMWVYKMRSMVYLWARYYRIQKATPPLSEADAKDVFATQAQWDSAIFHWQAKQALDELRRVSHFEWPEFHKVYPTLPKTDPLAKPKTSTKSKISTEPKPKTNSSTKQSSNNNSASNTKADTSSGPDIITINDDKTDADDDSNATKNTASN
ncbi:CG5792 [Drosophila busckii]|uniref:CG5792 n=1 Tax=Drosophila busckii TaxID=30019 RepID=A0A0M3QU76_DROBS|nr:uncharacterized protein LOC108606232 isoform X2 [Drosophila busckii]ALC40149.1 CG5792 [Drosophila busckii]